MNVVKERNLKDEKDDCGSSEATLSDLEIDVRFKGQCYVLDIMVLRVGVRQTCAWTLALLTASWLTLGSYLTSLHLTVFSMHNKIYRITLTRQIYCQY